MKRELSYALEAQSKLTESLGRTRSSSKSQPANADPLDSEALNEIEVGLSSSIDENRVRIHTSNAVRKNKRLKTNSRKEDDFLMIEQSKGACLSPIKEERRDFEGLVPRRVTRSAVKPDEVRLRSRSRSRSGNVGCGDCVVSREVEDEVVTGTRSVVQNSNKKIRLKKLKNRSTSVLRNSDKKVKLKSRSTSVLRNSDKKVQLKNRSTAVVRNSDKKVNRRIVVPRNAQNSDKKVNRPAAVPRNSDKKVNRPTVVLRNSDEKVKLKNMPTAVVQNSDKKINLKKPTTVQELIETGLLEGYPVSYRSDKKGNVLRGTIKDNGILCFCSLCKGTKVVMPSEFEVHARNLYKHEYICLENGKRLHEVVKACMRTPLKRLEKIIRSLVGPLPSKGSDISPNCTESEAELNTVGNSITLQAAPKSFGLRSGRMRTNKMFEDVRASEQPLDADSVGKLEKIQQKIQKPASEQPLDADSVDMLEKIQQKIQKPVSEQPLDANSVDRLEKIQQKIKKPASDQPLDANSVDRLEKIQQKIKKPSSKPVPVTNSPASTELCTSSRTKGRGKMKRKALEPPLAATSPKNDSVDIQEKSQRKMRKLLSRSVPVSNIKSDSKSRWKITKKDQRMHWLVFEENGLPEGTEVGYYSNGKNLLKGHKEGSGIFCNHCGTVVSASQFEVHAGCASRKKPYGYIYTSNGVSLHELAISLLKKRNHSVKDNDDLCIICKDGGNLLLCDGCPRAFHEECASLCNIPDGKWYCLYCENMFQRDKHLANNANALAAGRVSGVDPIEQIATRCIRIVKNPNEAVAIACILCRGFDYSKSGFGPNTVILCDQCEKEYHVGCLKERNMADLKELPKEKWFCCTDCQKIYTSLQNLVNSEAEKIQEPLLDVIKKKEIVRGSEDANEIDVRWNLLSGKSTTASRETRLLLAKAVAIFHECFDPIVDPETGHDFIPTMVYGRKIRGQDFRGMYCAVLTVNTVVVSAGILRVFGPDKAELPLVATSKAYQGKGYFQLLFSCIEKLLTSLEVKSLVLPAAEIAESIWTDRFSFEKITPEQLLEYRKDFWQMLTFKGTSMLEKQVPSQDIRTDATLV